MSSDQAIEQQIQAKGKTAPRVTPGDIEAAIASEHYFTAADGYWADGSTNSTDKTLTGCPQSLELLTFCVLVLRNGFTVTGESACASPENFDAELGRDIAKRNAVTKIWPLLGYELRTKLADAAPKRKVYTAKDIVSTDSRQSPDRFGYIVRATTKDGKTVEVEARDLLNSPHDALTLILDKLNEAPE